MTNWDQVDFFVKNADSILVVSHRNPDGDAISSTLIVGKLLRSLGKKVTMVNESSIPRRFHYLDGIGDILQSHEIQGVFQYAIMVDCADLERIGECRSLLTKDVRIVNIDHHKTNNVFGSINIVDHDAAATAELLFDWITSTGIDLDLSWATMIYTGMLTDTGGFRFSNTSSKTLKIAAELLEVGVNPYQIADFALESMTPEYVALLQIALQSLKISSDGRIAWMALSFEDLAPFSYADCEGIVQYTRNIIGVEVGVFFREPEKKKVKISFRSKSTFDVAAFAQRYGGGGHLRAAGCEVDGSLGEIQAHILEQLTNELEREV